MTERGRANFQVGAVITGLIFMIGVTFNAGIEYANIHDLQMHQAIQDEQIKELQQIPSRLTRIETILQQIQAQQAAAAQLRSEKPNT